jgi:hypothetical protein
MRALSRVRMSDVCSMRTSDASCVSGSWLLFDARTLANDGHGQESDDAREKVQRLPNALVTKDVPRFEVPGARFSCGSEGILIEATAVTNRASGIGLGVIGRDRTQGLAQLNRYVPRTLIGSQRFQISPRSVCGEKRQAISGRMPERITGYFHRQRFLPRLKLVIDRHTAHCTSKCAFCHPSIAEWYVTELRIAS